MSVGEFIGNVIGGAATGGMGSAATAAAEFGTAMSSLASKLIDRWFPDKSEQERVVMAFALQNDLMESEELRGQMKINEAQAQSASVFVAGPRPAIMWVGAFAFFMYTIPSTLLSVGIWAWQCFERHELLPLPIWDFTLIIAIMLPLLGIRSLETIAGKARQRIK